MVISNVVDSAIVVDTGFLLLLRARSNLLSLIYLRITFWIVDRREFSLILKVEVGIVVLLTYNLSGSYTSKLALEGWRLKLSIWRRCLVDPERLYAQNCMLQKRKLNIVYLIVLNLPKHNNVQYITKL